MNILTSLYAVLGITVVVIIHELGHYLVARAFKMRVLRYSLGFGPVIAKYQPKGSPTIFQVCALPLLAYVQIDGMNPAEDNDPKDTELFCNKSAFARLMVILAGPAANYLAASVIVFSLYAIGGKPEVDPTGGLVITEVTVDAPASRAGIQLNDEIYEANGAPVHEQEDLAAVTRVRAGQPTVYRVRRAGQELPPFTITPMQAEPAPGEAPRGIIGIRGEPTLRFVDASFGELLSVAVQQPIMVTLLQIGGVTNMVRNLTLEGIGGPRQMVEHVASQAERGVRHYVFALFNLSIALGFFNLLPIPALDGGRAVFVMVEAVTRRKLNAKLETVATLVGFVMLISLIVFVSFR
jgi:regulator of sigma E protease